MSLRPRGTGLTARQPALILTDTDHFLNLGADTRQATDLCRRQGEAIGGELLGAVADDQDFHTPRPPTALRPIRVAPKGPERLAIEAASLLQAADKRPAIVPNPFQERFRGLPGVAEDILRATAQAIASIASVTLQSRVGTATMRSATPITRVKAQRCLGRSPRAMIATRSTQGSRRFQATASTSLPAAAAAAPAPPAPPPPRPCWRPCAPHTPLVPARRLPSHGARPEMWSNYDFGNLLEEPFKFFRHRITSHETS
jgi:hypothetical protein